MNKYDELKTFTTIKKAPIKGAFEFLKKFHSSPMWSHLGSNQGPPDYERLDPTNRTTLKIDCQSVKIKLSICFFYYFD
ncbi:hypothetical protein AOB46_16890 [Chryseobacterium indologenes]|uniref:Uncharacterized protein n=1 Tax=Chryseobacterium indologenes TaxID=253 RepID=A0A0N1KS73_CHRID|nr:hypothetical protein AOB46_16890 [Chryseobacterium indologenes]